MKNIKQIRENFDLITEKEEKEDRKLSALVRAGLYDAKKLPALKRALDKSADKMTGQEKRMLLNLLDSLISQVTSDEQVYRKVRQNVHSMNEAKEDYLSKFDPRFKPGYPSDKDIPTVLILKRKAIRVYPDNQKVALYYSQALDKYVTIPFSEIQTGINEAVEDDEEKKRSVRLRNLGPKVRVTQKAIKTAHFLSGKEKNSSTIGRAMKVGKEYGAGAALGDFLGRATRRAVLKTRLALRNKSKAKTNMQEQTQVDENIVNAVVGLAKLGAKLGSKAASGSGKTIAGVGSKVVNKFKSARGIAGKIGRGAARVGRGAGRLARGAAGLAAGAAAGAAGAAAGAAEGQKDQQSTARNYGLGQLKPKTGSSWENRADSNRSQQQRDAQLNRRSQASMVKENTNVFSTIKEMANNDIKEQTILFNEQKININNTVAKKIMLVYESVNNTNKKKMEKMLNESATSFNKVLTFALRQ